MEPIRGEVHSKMGCSEGVGSRLSIKRNWVRGDPEWAGPREPSWVADPREPKGRQIRVSWPEGRPSGSGSHT